MKKRETPGTLTTTFSNTTVTPRLPEPTDAPPCLFVAVYAQSPWPVPSGLHDIGTSQHQQWPHVIVAVAWHMQSTFVRWQDDSMAPWLSRRKCQSPFPCWWTCNRCATVHVPNAAVAARQQSEEEFGGRLSSRSRSRAAQRCAFPLQNFLTSGIQHSSAVRV